MLRNEDFLELRESYIEIGKMVQKNMDMDNITGY